MFLNKRSITFFTCFLFLILISGCANYKVNNNTDNSKISNSSNKENSNLSYSLTKGTDEYNGFLLDNVLHTKDNEDIHYNVYIPRSYNGEKPYALFITLPGYEGLYFQGVGKNLEERFGFEAQKYNKNMIVLAPQLNDWGETSANQTITLIKYFLENYNIDNSKIYANGYSGGGETMSLVLEKNPELFSAYLHCSSRWDGEFEKIVQNKLPIYLVIGKDDEYYGSAETVKAYKNIYNMYKKQGLKKHEIDELLVLDLKERDYFENQGVYNEHAGGATFAFDKDIMQWLFEK